MPVSQIVPDLKLIFGDLIRFETELWNDVDARLRADLDLPLSRLEPMQVISRHPSCRVHDIADELSITVGGTSKLVDRIEASGFCRRLANPEDRRSSIIELTPAGRRILTRAVAVLDDELQTRLGAAIPARTLGQFSSALVLLRAARRTARATGRVTRTAS